MMKPKNNKPMLLREKVARKLLDFDKIREIPITDRTHYYKAAERLIFMVRIHDKMNPKEEITKK